ncbi:UTP--glucose-1-phosphate uridylyltransferase [Mariprofundus micogutta]|uniref:UTP--glucose-1-phosphate uridylyltransferase n=1 Tax=Mariprofundus micogutta TaxID=1921010 RepID=A0A1L8CN17_9PROT|nr:UTP--glucose-1-phosphate uridylyltransferase GalU [Mariprofundus micogutta]GAV20219.1 UTP--glucose-1-phosphate uridylyltransferase [Mariprofundus micogutta]
MKPLRKIIFPAAGNGTRFLPATKATPKEMLTIVDKPLIQYGVEEALAADMEQIIMITGRGKRAIEDHFDISAELETSLKNAGKSALYQEVSRVARMAEVIYVRQKQALGLGHAVLCARHWVGDEAFGVSLADELIISDNPAMQQLRQVYDQTGCSVVGLMQVPADKVHKYGIVAYKKENNGLLRLTDMVEKPAAEDAPSDMAIVGRYIFTPRLMDLLREVRPGSGDEIQLTDAIAALAKEQPVYGVLLDGQRFDAGNPEGFLQANAVLGMQHPQYGEVLRKVLKEHL